MVGRSAIIDAVDPGGLGGTYGGNPIACAAGLAVLEVFEEEKLLERSANIGERITGRMTELAASNRFSCIGEVRGLGAMVAIELVEDRASNKPAAALTKRWTENCVRNGLVLLTCGVYGNVARRLLGAADRERGGHRGGACHPGAFAGGGRGWLTLRARCFLHSPQSLPSD